MPNILIIDDDTSTQAVLTEFFNKQGFQVCQALDGEAGLKCFEEHHPDIVLTDIYMPNGDGYKVIKALRKVEHTPKIPIIVISGTQSAIAREDAFYIGADAWLTKPIQLPVLADRVRELLPKTG